MMRITNWLDAGKPEMFLGDEKLHPADLVFADDGEGAVSFIDYSKATEQRTWNDDKKEWETHRVFTKDAIDAAGGNCPMLVKHGIVRFVFPAAQ